MQKVAFFRTDAQKLECILEDIVQTRNVKFSLKKSYICCGYIRKKLQCT